VKRKGTGRCSVLPRKFCSKELVVVLRPGVGAHVRSKIGNAVDQELDRVLRIVGVETGFLGYQLELYGALTQYPLAFGMTIGRTRSSLLLSPLARGGGIKLYPMNVPSSPSYSGGLGTTTERSASLGSGPRSSSLRNSSG